MTLTYRIDVEQGLVTISGDYAAPDEWRALLNDVKRDPLCRPGFAFLRDLRRSAHPVTPETVVGIIAVVRELWSQLGVRRAAMVTRPGIDIPAMVAHALAEVEQIPLRVFTSYDEALQWLAEP